MGVCVGPNLSSFAPQAPLGVWGSSKSGRGAGAAQQVAPSLSTQDGRNTADTPCHWGALPEGGRVRRKSASPLRSSKEGERCPAGTHTSRPLLLCRCRLCRSGERDPAALPPGRRQRQSAPPTGRAAAAPASRVPLARAARPAAEEQPTRSWSHVHYVLYS